VFKRYVIYQLHRVVEIRLTYTFGTLNVLLMESILHLLH